MEHNEFWDNEDERCECEDCQYIRDSPTSKQRDADRIWASEQRAAAIAWNLFGGFEDEV